MKHIKYFLLSVLLLCVLSSCGKGESNLKEKICSPDKNINELVSRKYSNSQLLTIAQLEVTMEGLDKQYPIECLKEIENFYRVSYLGNDSVSVIYFDSSENKLFGRVYGLYLEKDDFIGLTAGQSLESVQKIDPHGEYLFLYTGSDNAPRVSTHYTKDGYIITVNYDDENTISSVTTDLI